MWATPNEPSRQQHQRHSRLWHWCSTTGSKQKNAAPEQRSEPFLEKMEKRVPDRAAKYLTWGDTQGLHCKYPGELHTIPYNFVIRNSMGLSRRLFFIRLGAADFVTYDQREVFFPTPFCQENVIIWKQTRHDRVARLKPAKIKGFSSSISEVSFVSIWSK